jgi:SH3-like domain-containing protein
MKMGYLQRTLFVTLIFVCVTNISCVSHEEIRGNFNNQKKYISNELIPDETLNIFNAHLVRDNDKWILKGRTTLKEAENRVVSYTNKLLGENNYQNNFILLPHENLGDKKYGIIKVCTANLREQPRHSAQLVDQVIIGHTVKLLKESPWWFMVQTQYGYIGWMTKQSIYRTHSKGIQEWTQGNRVTVKSIFAFVYSEPDHNSVPVSGITMNGILKLEENQGGWLKVSTPDSRIGYIEELHIAGVNDAQSPDCTLRQKIIRTAKTMTGIPYLWGGNSSTANDCSGFTQTVFRANGIELLRDARQQAREGVDVEFDLGYEKILPGDLLFFGDEDDITHVGISLGGPGFIHQGGFVHESSLDPNDKNYSSSSRRRLKIVKRIITEEVELDSN